MRYVIGIDCGATKSEAIIMPALKGVLPEHLRWGVIRFPAINFNLLGFSATKKRLIEIIKKATAKIKLSNVDFICAGLSGARFEKDRSKLEDEISSLLKFKNIKIYPDTEIAFASIFEQGEKNCGILIAGTGSILYYKDSKGKLKRAGGWGRHIGDEGSGHWIALQALKRVTEHIDRIGSETSISLAIKKEFDLTADNLIEHVYHKGFEISRITPHVFRCAEKKDKAAIEIIENAAESLAKHFKVLGKAIARVALVGSLFSNESLLEKYLRKIVKNKYPNVTLVKPEQNPVWGAVKLAMNAKD